MNRLIPEIPVQVTIAGVEDDSLKLFRHLSRSVFGSMVFYPCRDSYGGEMIIDPNSEMHQIVVFIVGNNGEMGSIERLIASFASQDKIDVVVASRGLSKRKLEQTIKLGATASVAIRNDCDLTDAIIRLIRDRSKARLGESKASLIDLMDSLTDRERQVVQLVAEGLTNRQISMKINRSIRAVEDRRASAMKKLGNPPIGDIVQLRNYINASG